MRLAPASALVLACLLLALCLTWDRVIEVWQTGAFFDSDDAMRALQVRTWLGGQNWFDLRVARVDPPTGLLMHWSRVVDVTLAPLVLLGQAFLDAVHAERFARIVWPIGMFAGLLVAVAWAAAAVGGVRARIPALALCFLGAPFLSQFIPGRIDHHAPQIVLLVLMTAATLYAFHPQRARIAAVAGLCAALSLSISLENVPFIAVVATCFPLTFVAYGTSARSAMVWFAGVFAAALFVLFFATVAPGERLHSTCDAYSIAHFAAGMSGCAALGLLAAASRNLPTVRARLVGVVVLAPLPLLAVVSVAPNCLGDPFVGLDPLVRDLWLHNVAEVEPLTSFFSTHPWSAIAMGVPVLCAIPVAFLGAVRGTGIVRMRALLLTVLLLVGMAMALWGIRALSSALPLVAIAAAPFVRRFGDRVRAALIPRAAALTLASLPFAPLLLAFTLPADALSEDGGTLSCLTPAALAPVAGLPPGIILAPIGSGAHVLAFTPHAVFGAPYHRNNHGNRLVLDAFLARPDDARAIVQASGVDYVMVCPQQQQAGIVAKRAPDGLAAALRAGRVPDWLRPLDLDTPQHVYKVKRTGA